MNLLQWKLLPLLTLLASVFLVFYLKDPSESCEKSFTSWFQPSQNECSLLPHKHFWITSKRIVTPQGVISGAVEINGGRIVSIVKEEERHGKIMGNHVVDYADAVVMPGLVDVHVHLDDPGRSEWEGFPSGTKAAAAGGVTTLVDMPLNNFPSTTSEETLKLKIKAAEGRIYVDVGFWGGLVPENAFNASALENLLKAGALGLKLIVTSQPYAMHMSGKATSYQIGNAKLMERLDEDPTKRLLTTDLVVEEAAVRELLKVTNNTRPGGPAEGAHIHVAHLSDSGSTLELIKEAKRSGDSVSVETCTHYLAFSEEDIKDGDTRFKCAPPIRDKANKEKLWDALMVGVFVDLSCYILLRSSLKLHLFQLTLQEGHIDMLSSDHSPTVPDLKLPDSGDFLKAWGGISSLQFDLSATWSHAKKRGVTMEQLALWWSERPAKLAGLELKWRYLTTGYHPYLVDIRKPGFILQGAIAIGKHADIVAWAPDEEYDVNDIPVYLKHPVCPSISAYMGMKLSGKVLATFVRGQLVYEEKHAPAACGTPILATVTD
uniref:Allantoinase n=1 Tax=Cucumis melo TaxID=3656 RepID=A0A9I9CEZ8_CUCME